MTRVALLAVLLAASPAFAASSISKVNGSIHAGAEQAYDELSTVNGSIQIDDGAIVDSADTVNGSIQIGDRAVVGTAETVNGKIELGRQARVDRDASTVNGGIRLDTGAEVGGNVETVNGTIRTEQARIGGRIETVGGSILIGDGSEVAGGLVVRRPRGNNWFNFGNNKTPRVEIGANAVIRGELRFDREVELVVHPSATIGPIVGEAASKIRVERR